MDDLKEFTIRVSGLSTGSHQYQFETGDLFFESFDYGEIRKGAVTTTVDLEKQETMMILDFNMKGLIRVNCDRCLGEFDLPVAGKERLIVKFGNEPEGETDDILVIPDKEHELNISHHLYEFISLLLPFKKVHGEDGQGNSLCDPEVIKVMDGHQEEPGADPRWDALKKLKDK